MLKKLKELHTVPFFWTTMLGKSIHYAGRTGQRRKELNRFPAELLIHQLGPGLVNTQPLSRLWERGSCGVYLKQLKLWSSGVRNPV